MAAWVRRGTDLDELIYHTDAGSQYTSIVYTDLLDDLEIATCGWVGWFNEQRLHGELDDATPAEIEAAHHRFRDAAGDRPIRPVARRPLRRSGRRTGGRHHRCRNRAAAAFKHPSGTGQATVVVADLEAGHDPGHDPGHNSGTKRGDTGRHRPLPGGTGRPHRPSPRIVKPQVRMQEAPSGAGVPWERTTRNELATPTLAKRRDGLGNVDPSRKGSRPGSPIRAQNGARTDEIGNPRQPVPPCPTPWSPVARPSVTRDRQKPRRLPVP